MRRSPFLGMAIALSIMADPGLARPATGSPPPTTRRAFSQALSSGLYGRAKSKGTHKQNRRRQVKA